MSGFGSAPAVRFDSLPKSVPALLSPQHRGSEMKNVIVYLVGPPGVGKYTVGKVIAERLSAKLLDSHFWCNPIFEVVERDGAPFPAGVWDRANEVMSAVLETVALFRPAERNYICTHAVWDAGGEEQLRQRISSEERLRPQPELTGGYRPHLACGRKGSGV